MQVGPANNRQLYDLIMAVRRGGKGGGDITQWILENTDIYIYVQNGILLKYKCDTENVCLPPPPYPEHVPMALLICMYILLYVYIICPFTGTEFD